MDQNLNPPWTLLRMVKALKFRLFIIPPEQNAIEMNRAIQMVNNMAMYQRQS